MSEPVTIGEQTFINDPDKGWIDRKTKLPADKGLIKLLDSLKLKPVESKLKIKIDKTREPVFLNGQKFVYDKNSGWIDEKTKIRIPDNLQKILESATKPVIEEMAAATEQVAESFGVVGSAAKQRVRTKNPPKVTPKKQATANRIANNKNQLAINTQFVKMITHLSSINGLLQQRKEQDIIAARDLSDQLDEAKIENAAQNDIAATKPDAIKEKGPDLFLLAVGGLLIANYIDPILNVVTTLSEGIYKVGSFTIDVVKAINSAFTFVSGGNKQEQTPTTASGLVTSPQKPETETKPDAVSQPPAPPATPTAPTETPKPQSKNTTPFSSYHNTSKPAKSPARVSNIATPARTGSVATPARVPTSKQPATTPAKQTSASTWTTSPISAGRLSNNPAIRNKAFATDATKKKPSGNINPTDVLAFSGRSGDQNHFNILEPETKEAILSAAAEYKQTTGKKLTINSARRTNQEQQILWNNRASNPNPVAPPGTSNHEKGWAVDIGQRDDPTAKSILEKHGMMWYGSNDPVHYTLKGHGEGGGGISGAIAGAVDQGKETLGDIIKGFARIVDGKSKSLEGGIAGIAQRNKSSYAVSGEKMDIAQSQRHADVIEALNPPPEPRQTAASLPNLNAGNPSLGIKTPVTTDDKRIVYDYLRYFKVIPQDTSGPALVLAK